MDAIIRDLFGEEYMEKPRKPVGFVEPTAVQRREMADWDRKKEARKEHPPQSESRFLPNYVNEQK